MIILDRVTKLLDTGEQVRPILSGISMHIPTDRRIALLGLHEDEKKMFIDIIAAFVLPDSGRVIRSKDISFPAGEMTGVDPEMAVRFNIAHVARLYGRAAMPVVRYVEAVAKMGAAFDKPWKLLDRDAKREVGLITTLSMSFECYLFHREPVIPRKGSRKPSSVLLEARLASSAGMIVAVRNNQFAIEHCDMALLLHRGHLVGFSDVREGVRTVERLDAARRALR